MNTNSKALERLLWGIAFPGFSQFLNGKIVKGTILIILEILINMKSNLNSSIIASFHGDISTAIQITDYQWLMFYPCVYLFAIWDGYRDAGGGQYPFSFLPFAISAYLGTVGVIYSSIFRVNGYLIGPIFLPILSFLFGSIIGVFIQRFFFRMIK